MAIMQGKKGNAMRIPDYPDSRCEDSPSHAHYFVPLAGVKGVWRCKYCWVAQWLPSNWDESLSFHYSILRFGLNEAYQRQLQRMPEVVKTLNKLEEIRLLRKVLPKKQLMMAIAAIVEEGGEK